MQKDKPYHVPDRIWDIYRAGVVTPGTKEYTLFAKLLSDERAKELLHSLVNALPVDPQTERKQYERLLAIITEMAICSTIPMPERESTPAERKNDLREAAKKAREVAGVLSRYGLYWGPQDISPERFASAFSREYGDEMTLSGYPDKYERRIANISLEISMLLGDLADKLREESSNPPVLKKYDSHARRRYFVTSFAQCLARHCGEDWHKHISSSAIAVAAQIAIDDPTSTGKAIGKLLRKLEK